MDIKSKKWYDKMFAQVKELLEALVMQEAAIVGYFVLDIDGQKCTVSWTKEVMTVTAGPYKWAMPTGWFISDSDLELITTEKKIEGEHRVPLPSPVPPRRGVPQEITQGPRIAAVTADEDGAGDAYPTVTEEGVDGLGDSDSLLGERPRPRSGVPSASELADNLPDS